MTLLRLAALTALGSIAACSLVYGSDLDGAREGTSPTDDGGAFEASAPGSPGEGGVDGSDGTMAVTRGCSGLVPAPKFCDDFERGAFDANGWSIVDDGMTITSDPLAFSGERSVRVFMAVDDDCSFGRLERGWLNTNATSRVDVHVNVRPSSNSLLSANGTLQFLAIQLGSDERYCAALLRTGRDRVLLNVQHDPNFQNDFHDLAGRIPAERWTDVGVAFLPGPSLVVTIQDDTGATQETTLSVPQCPSLGSHLRIGVGFHCEVGDGEMRYDDVRVDWQ